jgi:hypothetical protein
MRCDHEADTLLIDRRMYVHTAHRHRHQKLVGVGVVVVLRGSNPITSVFPPSPPPEQD